MHAVATNIKLRAAAGASGQLDPIAAAEAACDRCIESLEAASGSHDASGSTPRIDLAFVFISMQHLPAASAIAEVVRVRLQAGTLIGCTGEAVVAGDQEMEGAPGVSVFAISAKGLTCTAFTGEDLEPSVSAPANLINPALESIAKICGFGACHRATFVFADPFSTKLDRMLPMLSKARNRAIPVPGANQERQTAGPILGGLASASGKPGGNVLILNDRVLRAGLVGVSVAGPIRVDSIVSQGCKPITPTMVITAVKGQMITGIGGRPALEVLNEHLAPLPEETKQKLSRGLFIGRAVNEYKDRFGRDDFLMRNVIGVQRETEAVAVADVLRVGQTVQFHVRDAQTAHEDLALLLDAQKLHDTPAGVLLLTCNGRGTRLFARPNHDASAICRAFAPDMNAEQRAKGGRPLPALSAPLPLAGFFCAGEIGPVGDEVFQHGQTACAAVFRAG